MTNREKIVIVCIALLLAVLAVTITTLSVRFTKLPIQPLPGVWV